MDCLGQSVTIIYFNTNLRYNKLVSLLHHGQLTIGRNYIHPNQYEK